MNVKIRNKINEKKFVCKCFSKNGRSHEYHLHLRSVSVGFSKMISKRKEEYHEQLAKKRSHS